MAPEVDPLSAAPEFVHVPAPPGGSFIATPVQISGDIDGSAGGTLTNGRFHLNIPPGAFSGIATLTRLETLWFDELAQRWVLVLGSAVESASGRITTPLQHFSEYGVIEGKAGW
jgi:hypothetical protein